MDMKQIETKLEVIVDSSITSSLQSSSHIQTTSNNQTQSSSSSTSILSRLHAGYFRISFSLCSQVLLWKTLGKPINDGHHHALRHIVQMLPSEVFLFLWFTSLLTLAILSFLYTLRCFFYFNKVKAEFLHDVGVNYLFAPWISWLLLLESSPFALTKTIYYKVLWSVFTLPVVILDVKIYGQWFTKGKRFLSIVANPTSQLSVIGNLVSARVAAVMGLKETALFLFTLGMVHYVVLFVTLYQRFSGRDKLPAMLRPVFFLFFAAPSMASLAWYSISGTFDTPSKMLFFLSLFLFTSVVSRPTLFKRSMRKFNVAWWAYPFPLTVMALASAGYSQEVKSSFAHGLMIALFVLSVVVTLGLLLLTVLNTKILFRMDDPVYDQM